MRLSYSLALSVRILLYCGSKLMKIFKFSLHLSAQDMQSYYSGACKTVYVKGNNGRSIQFPAEILRPFVAHDGVHGWFQIEVDDNNKLIDIKRTAPQ